MDRAALDVARELGIPHGGWCPKGRLAEDGPIPLHYPLKETASPKYAQRTDWNVRDSDATLVLTVGEPEGGTALTVGLARKRGRPYRVIDLASPSDPAETRAWLERWSAETLNVAGPRESSRPGIYERAAAFLREVLAPPES